MTPHNLYDLHVLGSHYDEVAAITKRNILSLCEHPLKAAEGENKLVGNGAIPRCIPLLILPPYLPKSDLITAASG